MHTKPQVGKGSGNNQFQITKKWVMVTSQLKKNDLLTFPKDQSLPNPPESRISG